MTIKLIIKKNMAIKLTRTWIFLYDMIVIKRKTNFFFFIRKIT